MYRLLFTFLLTSYFSFSQEDKAAILSKFMYVEYYPDSTIKKVCEVKKLTFNGTTILFDSIGQPITIGSYTNGKESGVWTHSNGSSTYYSEKEILGINSSTSFPGCGTGFYLAKEAFRKKYQEIIHP